MKSAFIFLLLVSFFLNISCNNEPQRIVKQYGIEQFYKNKQIYGGNFSPDEKHILVTSNESGIYNLFEISVEEGNQKQLTNSSKESFFA
ncbi:MAG TPA: hypothetical protein VLM39_13175, partial [Ignavibacteriaceae bacterium]|nr:hypothetical protein [Ignavibacteriaceae bacterium]